MTPTDQTLRGLRVMVVEDQYTIAAEMRRLLEPLGVAIVGPYPGVQQAMRATKQDIDVALLDVNLHGVGVFPVADELKRLGIPYAFVTAYEAEVLPPAHQSTKRIEKPVDQADLVKMLHTLAGARVARSA
jgi:CheY-like chemotaxis protein